MHKDSVRRITRADDEELRAAVVRAQGGDDAAFGRAYEMVQPMLLGYLRRFAGAEDVEDLAAEVWYEIARDIARFRGDGSAFRGWAASIARLRAVDAARRRRARPRTTLLEHSLLDMPGRHDTALEALEAVTTRQVIELVGSLPREQAEAVLLHVVAGLDSRAVGRMLGKQPSAVRMASHRGIRRLAGRWRDTWADRPPPPGNRPAVAAHRSAPPGGGSAGRSGRTAPARRQPAKAVVPEGVPRPVGPS